MGYPKLLAIILAFHTPIEWATASVCTQTFIRIEEGTARILGRIAQPTQQYRFADDFAERTLKSELEPLARALLSTNLSELSQSDLSELNELATWLRFNPHLKQSARAHHLIEQIEQKAGEYAAFVHHQRTSLPVMSNRAEKGLKRLDSAAQKLYYNAARSAKLNPYAGATKVGFSNKYRFLHFSGPGGMYRVCYEILPERAIEVVWVGPHENFYNEISDLRKQ